MTEEQQTPPDSPTEPMTPTSPSLILGADGPNDPDDDTAFTPETPDEPEQVVADTPPVADPAEPTDLGITADELSKLREKGAVYDMLDGDPVVADLIQKHYRAQPVEPDNSTPGAGDSNPAVDRRISALESATRQLLAKLTLSEFSRVNPDFEQHKPAVGNLMTKHPTMTLDEALASVKRSSPTPTAPANNKPLQVAETTPTVAPTPDLAAQTLATINDPSTSDDRAMDLAWEEAKRLERAKQS